MITLALALFVSVAGADVSYGSLHYSDMAILDAVISAEYYGVEVLCLSQDGNINIGIVLSSNWTGSDYQFGQLGYCIGAGGGLTTVTSWHSDNLFVIYNNKGFICTTSAAREFANNAEYWSNGQIIDWIANNLGSEYL